MRITIVVPGGVGADGVREVIPALLSLIGRLADRHEVLVIATDQVASPSTYSLRGARIVCLGGSRRGLLGRARVFRAVLAELRRFRPDVIHAIWLGPGSSVALVAGRLLDSPVIASIGGGELVAIPRIRYGGRLGWRGRLHARAALRFAAAVTAGSRYALGPLASRRPNARWLPLGAEPPDQPAIEVEDRGTARLLVVASLNRVKGPDVVIGALARLTRDHGVDARLDWIGQDTLDGSIAALASSLGLADSVTFHGFLAHGEVLAALESADLLVQGSYHEGQGVAVLEAAMRGVPTVGTAVGLVAELAALEPPAAVAVPVGNAAALADAIAALLREPARRAAIGAAARAWALAHDADWTAAAFEALYAEVVARG